MGVVLNTLISSAILITPTCTMILHCACVNGISIARQGRGHCLFGGR